MSLENSAVSRGTGSDVVINEQEQKGLSKLLATKKNVENFIKKLGQMEKSMIFFNKN